MDESTIIKMELPLGAWNYIINLLADQKYKDSVNIINEFSRQAQRSFDVFRADVLRAREGVPDDAMQGQVFDGHQARRVGLVDALGDLGYAKAVARRLAKGWPGSD